MPGDHNSSQIRVRRHSLVAKWMEDQQYLYLGPDDAENDAFLDDGLPIEPIGTPSHAYLAYPHLRRAASPIMTDDDAGSLHNYVVVDGNNKETINKSDGAEVSTRFSTVMCSRLRRV